ncbi:ATP-binding protein [Parasulfitobacter algicola]|uniref:histidine kinase n=1 Tax=Parasulfitobacter algicola TaxID=2614809 RepID=A0ABX2ISD6_9RHOB|nr:ATP-binding protein [Sulfitobacter algicola]NSX55818.1 HAMP domain-containing protein [Sulfitobacter algicola]
MFGWLKNYLPRSLYGRAALILVLPILVLQIAFSIGFIQRHFADVTNQMTRNIGLEVDYLLQEVQQAPNKEAAMIAAARLADPLALRVQFDAPALSPARLWYDFTGLTVISTLRNNRPEVGTIDLASQNRRVLVELETRHGTLLVNFDRRRVSASNPHQLLVWMVFTGILMTVIAFIFLRNQLRPIKRLADAATAFGKGQVQTYKPSGAAEVRVAGNAFLDMRNRIERQIEQRTLMLSGVSHDLRTPLTRLKLGLSMIDDPEVEAMQRDISDMQRMLDEFLNFARDDASDAPEKTDPIALTRQIVEDAKRSGNAVQLISVSGQGHVMMRPTAVRRAIDNLIGNAVRYGTRADVSVALMDNALRITVEDDGPGIPSANRKDAVKPFTRLEPGRNQNKGSGVGLGLSIANDIARVHGGALRLGESETLGGLKADLVLAR